MRTSVQPKNFRRASLLIESIVYIAVFSVLLTLAILSYNRFDAQSRHLRGATEDIARAMDAGERWRDDVRNASGHLEYKPETGELVIPQRAYSVVYRFSENSIHRKAGAGFVPLLKNVKVSSMQKNPRKYVTTWRWELELNTRGKNAKLRPLFQFEAVVQNQS